MQVAITCRHGSIRDDIQELVTGKVERLLTYFERVTAIQVTFDFSKDRVSAEILVDAEHRHNFVAMENGADVITAFDGAFHKMEQQIKKYKQKVQDHRRDVAIGNLGEAEEEPEEPDAE